ncbi:uncharacterized protein LAJ45_10421 [Morchella importuna]|uniref:uncharacterized protein n=1 Tax=Morchella importuna TaxID=1174673 RepID=UPI001E8DAF93|nr:uncharacterized protein LAJ45_10421 [Morchella importuna]KAH8145620.1 hypothetical protein LAJ45_10421 [Morchella importuna]
MSSSSSLPPVLTPRFRPHAEEEPFLPRYTEDSEPARLFLKKRTWLTRGRVILLSALLSLLVWGLIVVVPEILDPTPVVVPVVDFESVRNVNATLIPGGKGKWTVRIPRGIQEPLRPRVYAGICRSVHDVAGHVHRGYYSFDEKFVDPAKSGEKVVVEKGVEVCDASLTYMLESKNAGFGVALMGLWSAYGLAKKEGRSFFINDRDWAWGAYTSFFLQMPRPKCAPPPPHWMLPCPHSAKHLVVAASTHTYIFGHSFNDEFEDARQMGVLRQSKIFDFVREGYEALFRLGLLPEDQDFVEVRKKKLIGPVMSVHIRRGDKKALAWEYVKTDDGFVPPKKYVEAALEMRGKQHGDIVYASDDVHMYESAELVDYVPAQGEVAAETWLGELEVSQDMRGFVADDFWRLDPEQKVQLGRAYLKDLKILGEMAARGEAATVCDVASTTCRLLAVIMGWERAVVQKRWKNVDGEFDWSGVAW